MTIRSSSVSMLWGISFREDRQDGAARHFYPSDYQPTCLCPHGLHPLLSSFPSRFLMKLVSFFLPHARFLLPNYMIHLYLLMGPSKSILNIKTFNGSNSVQLPAALPWLSIPLWMYFHLTKNYSKDFFFFGRGSCCVAQCNPKLQFSYLSFTTVAWLQRHGSLAPHPCLSFLS